MLGATGMAGHVISIYLSEQGHEVTTFSRKKFLYCENIIGDAFNLDLLSDIIFTGGFDVVINCIGILNRNAEKNKDKAVFLNSYLPHYLSSLTRKIDTRIFHMSTDCVFSGKTGGYKEHSLRDGEVFYDRSKALGEIENQKDLTFRNSIIGPDMNMNGIGLFNWFMKQETTIKGYNRAIWTGVTTITLARTMEKATVEKLSGLYNLVNNDVISKYNMLNLFNKFFKQGRINIELCNDVVIDKSLVNTRVDFDFVVPSYEEMIIEMKKWIMDHKELYPHYF